MASEAYLDTSLLVPLFVIDSSAERARAFMETEAPTPIVSDFAAAEFASAISQLVRTNALYSAQAASIFSMFDTWRAGRATECWVEQSDVATASAILRRLDSALRTPDALHLAMARRIGVPLATFDQRLAEIAMENGVVIAPA